MRIGINLNALSKSESFKTVSSQSEYQRKIKKTIISDSFVRVMNEVIKDEHEVFVFAPTPVELSDKIKVKLKKKIINKLKSKGINIEKVAIVDENDISNVYERNRVVIAVDNESSINEQNKITDVVSGEDDLIIDELLEKIELNRTPVTDMQETKGGLPSEEKLWNQFYSVGDYKWNDSKMSPYDRLLNSNIDWKDEVALEYFGFKYSYAHFFREIDRVADHLVARGVKKGMKVPFIFANTPEAMFTLYALYKIKATIVPLSPLIKNPEIELRPKLDTILQQNKENGFDTSYFFITDALYGKMKSGIPSTYTTVVETLSESMPKPISAVVNMVLSLTKMLGPIKYDEHVIRYRDFIKGEVPHYEGDTSYDNEYDAVQLYTGGSIRPKAVILSEENVDATARQFYNDKFDFRRNDKIAAFMPLHHSFGLIIGTHVATTLGVTLDLIPKINFNKIYSYFLKDKVNIFGGIPNMFPSIVNDKKLKNADLKHVKYILSGGSKLKQPVRELVDNFFAAHNSNAKVRDGYGQTETAGGIIYDGVPNMGINVKIIDPDSLEELGYNQSGELCLSGPQIMRYYDEKELNEAVFFEDKNGKTWLRTGDAAVINNDGTVQYIERLDRMIKINGEQVVLSDLEELFSSLPFVEDCVVVGVPHNLKENATYAFITLVPGVEYSEDIVKKLFEYSEKVIPGKSHRPIKFDILPQMPKTAAGKNDFKTLGQIAREDIENSKTR